MISKISLGMNRQQSFGSYAGKSRANIENALKEYYKVECGDANLSRADETNLQSLDNSILEVSAHKIEDSNELHVSIYDPVTQADYFTGSLQLSGNLTKKLHTICKNSEKSRYTLIQ